MWQGPEGGFSPTSLMNWILPTSTWVSQEGDPPGEAWEKGGLVGDPVTNKLGSVLGRALVQRHCFQLRLGFSRVWSMTLLQTLTVQNICSMAIISNLNLTSALVATLNNSPNLFSSLHKSKWVVKCFLQKLLKTTANEQPHTHVYVYTILLTLYIYDYSVPMNSSPLVLCLNSLGILFWYLIYRLHYFQT